MISVARETVNRAYTQHLIPAGAVVKVCDCDSGNEMLILEKHAEARLRYWKRWLDVERRIRILDFLSGVEAKGKDEKEIAQHLGVDEDDQRRIRSAIRKLIAEGYLKKEESEWIVDEAGAKSKQNQYRELLVDRLLLHLETLAVDRECDGKLIIRPAPTDEQLQIHRTAKTRITNDDVGLARDALKNEGSITVTASELVITKEGLHRLHRLHRPLD